MPWAEAQGETSWTFATGGVAISTGFAGRCGETATNTNALMLIFGCLWSKPASKFDKDVVRLAASQDFYTAVVDFRRRWGHAPHPGAVVQSFCNNVGNLPTAPYATFLAEVVE